MAINVGNTTASLYLGATPVAAYLGTEQVYSAASVPGAPTITSAVSGGEEALIVYEQPSDGGSAITGYKFYVDGDLYVTQGGNSEGSTILEAVGVGAVIEVSAVNAIGEGPKSAPVTVVSV